MNVYWFGYGGSSYLAENLRPVIESLGMILTTIHEHENADIKWNLTTWKDDLSKADIIILPTNHKVQPAKSNNRLTQALSMGKPVICGSLESYRRVEERFPGCCLFADTQNQYREQLIKIRDSADLKRALSLKALEAAKGYSIEVIGKSWEGLFLDVDRTDIIIPTYNNYECLKLCIESIRACTTSFYNIIVINNGPDPKTREYLDNQQDIKKVHLGRCSFAQAINNGLSISKSKYVCLLNDDTIVSRGWLKAMISSCTDNVGAVGVLSNCDHGWLHNIDLEIGGVRLLPGSNTLDQIRPIIDGIYQFRSSVDQVPERDWVAFYCTLIPRKVVEAVGFLDEAFVNSGEDVDYCRRIRKMGYKIVQNYKSFVFHFGAVGRKILESENVGSYQEADRKTQYYLSEKWARENVVIYSGPSWEKWDFRNVDSGGIGGSETWVVCLARQFSNLGYRVKVFADCPEPGIMDGEIEWKHYSEYDRYIDQNWIDYFISSRTTDTLRLPVRAGKIYVMIHDVWLLSDRYQLYMDKVDKFCVLSQWHWDFVKEYHGIPDDKLWMTSNGIDPSRFDSIQVERDPYRLIYSSSPDRGLDTLLYLFDYIKAEVPQANLHIFYGFDNWEKSARMRNNPHDLDRIQQLKEAMNKPGIHYHGRVGQKQLALEFSKSSVLSYPGDFEESFCITAVEAQQAGCVVLASNYAGLRTTIGDSAPLVGEGCKGASYTKEYREVFVERCVRLLNDKQYWGEWSERGKMNAQKYSWNNVALSWKDLFSI